MKTKQPKADFEILKNNQFAYLDSGATSQHPNCVLSAVHDYYTQSNANPHRGAYSLSLRATKMYDEAREKVAALINSPAPQQIIFTKNATESLNLIAYSYGLNNLKAGDEVVLSIMEHHSMIVPWQMVCKKTGAALKYLYLDDDFKIKQSEIEQKITKNTKIVGISSVSNVLGTINDVQSIIKKAHSVGAIVIVDISQSIAHMPFDVQKTDADFAVFSSHKMFGPMGVGVLYGKKQLLDNMQPFLLGGDMIEYVTEQDTTYAPLPNKFEAGTQNAGGVVGLGAAVDYINSIGYENISKIEKQLMQYAMQKMSALPFVKLYCTKDSKCHSGVISFNIPGLHPHDVASWLDKFDVFIRSGHHCAQPLHNYLGIQSSCRVSLSVYNTTQDVDKLVDALQKIYEKFKKYIKV
ncbi:MAG: cysteine desulfurase [Clostridia bacterium]|nr:cysteine desulfurase [Clostridia bacterium]